MKLHGTIDRQELVKYLAREYGCCRHAECFHQANGRQDLAEGYWSEAVELRHIIRQVRDGAI